jgi:outer membrane protein assembly factor BamB
MTDVGNALVAEAGREVVRALRTHPAEVERLVPGLWVRVSSRRAELTWEELRRSHADLTAASRDGEAMIIRQEAAWESRLRDLLAEHPEAASDLHQVLVQLRAGARLIAPPARRRPRRAPVVLVAICVLVVLTAAAFFVVRANGRGDTPVAGGTPARPGAPVIGPGLPAGARSLPSVRWQVGSGQISLSPVIMGSHLLVRPSGTDVGIQSLSMSDGHPEWSFPGKVLSSGPVGADRIVVGVRASFDQPGEVVMLNMSDGQVVWRRPGGVGLVNVIGDHVVGPSTDNGGWVVFDAATGAQLWTVTSDHYFAYRELPDTVFAVRSGTLEELDIATGSPRSSVALPDLVPQVRRVVPANPPIVIVQSADENPTVTAFASDGLHKLWSTNGVGDVGWAETSRMLLTGTGEGTVTRLDPATGRQLWKHAGPAGNVNRDSTSQLGGDLIVIASRVNLKTLHVEAVDADTGEVRWTSEQDGVNGGFAALASDVTYAYGSLDVLGENWTLNAIDNATGRRLWSMPFSFTKGAYALTPVEGGLVGDLGGFLKYLAT